MNALPVFFIRVPAKSTTELTESLQDEVKASLAEKNFSLYEQLCDLGFLAKEVSPPAETVPTPTELDSSSSIIDSVRPKSTLIEDFSLFPNFLMFVRQVLQYHVIAAACVLNDAHTRCLGMFINSAFDMARDISITPKRVTYARAKEEELFRSLMEIANLKQEEIKDVIHTTIEALEPRLLEEASLLSIVGVDFKDTGELVDIEDLERCISQVQELVLSRLNQAVAGKLISSVDYLKESYVGTLTRCLQSLEKADAEFARESSGIASVALKQVRSFFDKIFVTYIHIIIGQRYIN